MQTKEKTFHISTAVFGVLRALFVLVMALVFITGAAIHDADAETGFDVQRFKPAIHTHGFIRVESAKISPGLDGDDWDARIPVMPNAFVVFNYMKSPSLAGTSSQTTLNNLSTLNFVSSLAFYNHFSIGFDLPLHLARSGQRYEAISNQLFGYPGAGIGDLRLSLKMAVYEARKKKPGVAVAIDFGIPTGSADGFTDEKAFFVEPKILLEASGPMIRIAYNASYLYRSKRLVDAVPSELDSLWDAADELDALGLNDRYRHEMRHMVGVGVAPKALQMLWSLCWKPPLPLPWGALLKKR